MELNKVLQRLKLAGLLFLSILVVGSTVFSFLDPEAGLLDAFYMTAITVSTIGFHEVIDLSEKPEGRLFTVFLAFSGIGIITYFFSNLASLFIEGEIKRNFERRKMEKRIAALEGHFIICGAGRVGRNIARELFKTERSFVMADLKPEAFEQLESTDNLGETTFLVGDCTEDEFLLKLGVERALGVFVTSGDDNINLVITLSVRTLNSAVKIVALSKEIKHVQKLRKAGASRVITPTFIGGLRMASEMVRPMVTNFLDDMLRSEFNQRIEELRIPQSSEGIKLHQLGIDQLESTVVLAINDDEKWIYKPQPDQELGMGSHLILLTNPKEKRLIEEKLT